MNKVLNHIDKVAWLNPQEEQHWSFYAYIGLMRQLVKDQMFPLTVDGIGRAIKHLS